MKIAIDGPAGAGKSTIARLVAKRMHAVYVDTGAMYRAMGLAVLRMGIRPEDGEAVGRAAEETSVSIVYRDGCQHVLLNGEDVTEHLRGEAVGNAASAISVYPAVSWPPVRMWSWTDAISGPSCCRTRKSRFS